MEVNPGYKQTEVGVIPEDWLVKPIGKVAPLQRGFDLPTRNIRPGPFPIVYSNGIDGFHNVAMARGPGVVTGRSGTLGMIHYVEEDYWPHNTSLWVTRFNANVPQFIYYLYQAVRFQRFASGSGVPTLNRNDAHSHPIALPSNLAEQRAIAAALSDVDALLGGLDRLIAKKRDLKQAAMQQLLTGHTRLPGFSGAWDELEFGEIASIRNTKVVASSVPSGTRCVELESIGGEGSGRLLMYTDASGMSSKYSFKKGDVLFGRLRAYLRKYWLATFDGICSTEIWPLIARDTRLRDAFLHLLVQTDDFVNAAGVSYGTHMPRSDWTVLKKLLVRLPPAPEQTAIAAVLSDMDAELAALEARRAKTRDLKQAMMQELLTGRTRLV